MKAETHLTLPREEDPTEAIARFVRGKWSSDFVVGRTRSMNQYEREVSVDAHRVDLIQDAATGGRVFAREVVPDIAKFVVTTRPKQWLIMGPPPQQAFENLRHQTSRLVRKSERALLGAAHTEMVRIPVVQMALSPIRSILVYLEERGSLPLAELHKTRKSPDQVANYVSLLQQIGYARRENGSLVPGSGFPTGSSDRTPTEVYDAMLARVMQENYEFLQQVLKLTQMVGYLRWSNSYYLTAFSAQDRVNLPILDWERRHDGYYPSGHRSALEKIGQLQRVLDSGIVVKQGRGVEGDPEITERFFELARAEMDIPSP